MGVRPTKRWIPTSGLLAGLLFLYLSSYVVVVRRPVGYGSGSAYDGFHPRLSPRLDTPPRYVVGGDVAETIFTPVHVLDQRVRPLFWHYPHVPTDCLHAIPLARRAVRSQNTAIWTIGNSLTEALDGFDMYEVDTPAYNRVQTDLQQQVQKVQDLLAVESLANRERP